MKIQKLKQAYFGDVAARYDANRAGAKWRAEQEAVREFLGRIRETLENYSLVDIPVGTGRFLEFYREFDVAATGLDVSGDMLAEAGKKAAALGYPVKLELGNILDLEDKAGGFDVALCIRLSNWLDADCLAQALVELSRTARRFVVFGVRVYPEAERTLPRALVQWLRERKRRLKGNQITIHREKSVQNAFAAAGLAVRAEREIERGAEGSRYAVYWLEKITLNGSGRT
jgi:ubiquinone/menaquinone biosynthesis C-methylase UbiE